MEKRRKTRQASDYLEYGGAEGLQADSMAEAEGRYIKDLIRAEMHVEEANKERDRLLQNTAERYGLETGKELDALLRDEYKEKTSKEFLVDGAILTCTNSTKDFGSVPTGGPCGEERLIGAAEGTDMGGLGIEGLDTNKVYAKLTVTENGFSSDGLMHATVVDSRPWVNIPCFGNCVRPADSEAEKGALQARYLNGNIFLPKDLKDSTMGTCVCLRKLEERWENAYIPFGSYATFQNGETGEELAGITMTSILFCKHGGFIYPVTSGQEERKQGNVEDLNMDDAIGVMTSYLRDEGISEEELGGVIEWVACNCGLVVNDMIEGDFSEKVSSWAHGKSMQYDNQILAWTYYWNLKIKQEFEYKFEMDPNIVKAIIGHESSFGMDMREGKNPSRNVMQSLATGNSTTWVVAGINPYASGMFKVGDSISYRMLDGTICTDGVLGEDNLPIMTQSDLENEREKGHFEDFEIIKSIFVTGEDGKYMVDFNNVTTDMSIAAGIGILAGKIAEAKDMYNGIDNYNTLGGYIEAINKFLREMGAEEIKPKGE